MFDDLRDLPPALAVEEAARVLGISRGTAYEGVRMYLTSGGASGIPAIKVGPRTIRVPRAALLRLLSEGLTDEHPDSTQHVQAYSERADQGGEVAS